MQFAAGNFPDIPIISGSVQDEGTLFAPQNGIDSDAKFGLVLAVLGGASVASVIPQISTLYPNDPRRGSPWRPELTGSSATDRFYEPKDTNQFKRLAAVLGDVLVNAPRRQQLRATMRKANCFSYLFAQPDPINSISQPGNGVAHGSDIEYVFYNPPTPFTGEVTNSSHAAAAKYAGPENIKRTADLMSGKQQAFSL